MSRANEPPTVLEDLSRDELLVLARQNEKALNDERVRADTAEKRAVLADTTNRSHRGRPRKRTRPTRSLLSDDENIPDDDQVEDNSPEEKMRRAGHKFTNQSQKKQEELRAVRDLLPEELRGELRREWAIFEFDKAMGRQRSNTSSRLRNDIEPVFNIHLKALDAERFKDVADVLEDAKRAGLADLIGGKKNAAGKITYHPLAAPVLHSDGSISHNPETFLHNKLVMHVAAAIIFGKQKARTLATGKGSSSSSRCMQDIHQITRTTPGVVRNASVLTLWTLSADTSLKKCGQQTAWLLNGLRNRHEPVLRLFREWDDELFPDTEASLGAALGTGSANTEDLHEALEALSHTQVVEMDTGSGDEDDVEGTTGADGMDGEGPRDGVWGGSQANESAEES
ncbi:hypothetical protein B0H14DRAFT_3139892 [Mycena olivaceomarginata]|nr:hypothetical protein B0H14DRAFT_3139892 [Mycena olivaceomarginata]